MDAARLQGQANHGRRRTVERAPDLARHNVPECFLRQVKHFIFFSTDIKFSAFLGTCLTVDH